MSLSYPHVLWIGHAWGSRWANLGPREEFWEPPKDLGKGSKEGVVSWVGVS
jgi:hypothetical protein